MGNYALLLVLAATVAISVSLHSSRVAAQMGQRRLDDHINKSLTARQAAATGLNLTLRKLAADTARWTFDPSRFEFAEKPYRYATFTASVEANYAPGPLIDECPIDTVDVVSSGYPEADVRGFANHTIETTVVRTCVKTGQRNDDDSFQLGFNLGGIISYPTPEPVEPVPDSLKRIPSGLRLVAYAEW